RLIAAQHRRNAVLLLLPVNVGDTKSRRCFDQTSQPHARPEDVFRVAGLAAASARTKRRKDGAVAPIATNGEIGETHFRQRAAKLAHRCHGGISACHLTEAFIAQIEATASKPGPRYAARDKPLLPPFQAETAAFKYAVVLINHLN